PRYGSNEEYAALAERARARGMGLIMDMIVNHSGSEHPWMDDLPSADWINHTGTYTETSHERTVLQDPYAAPADVTRMADGWFVPTMPDLNQRQPQLGDYLIQNALWWIETLGLSGIRMDTYPYPDKRFMTRWTARVMAEYPAFNIVGEEWSLNPAVVSYWQRGKVNRDGYVSHLPSLMDFPNQDALRRALTEPEQPHASGFLHLHRMLANDVLYPDPGALVIFADNHDMSRIYTQLEHNLPRWKMAMAWLLTMRGVPQVYYGTEVLMANPGTDDHGVIRSDFPGGFGGRSPNAFTGKGLSANATEARSFLRTLLRWRRDADVVHHGKLMHFVPRDGVYTWARYDGAHTVFVILNKNTEATTLDLARFDDVLAGVKRWRNVMTDVVIDRPPALELNGPGPLIFETAPER
ncbi:MAG: alpha-amylase family glycosyl hydrolase, partial [Pseudomonadota bacterium]